MYVTSWFMCLFTTLPCWDTVLTICDLLFLEGKKVEEEEWEMKRRKEYWGSEVSRRRRVWRSGRRELGGKERGEGGTRLVD